MPVLVSEHQQLVARAAEAEAAMARLRRLRDQLAAEHAKAVAADQQPRPDLPDLRVSPHNGIAAGLEIALHYTEHHLKAAAKASPAASPDSPLRQQIAAAIQAVQDGHAAPVEVGDERIVDAVMAFRDREMEQLRAKVAEFDHIVNWHTTCASCARILDSCYAETVRAETAEAAIARVQALVDEHPVAVGTHLLEEALDKQAHDGGPTVHEAKVDDRRWPLEKAGE